MTASPFITILEFVLALGVLAFLHEMGHFLLARLFKIEVEEFGIGLPLTPQTRLRLFKLWGTEFSLNPIPFGAFVRPKGENNPDIPGGLAAAKPAVRLAVLFGGSAMNLLVGVLLFSVVFARTGIPDLKTVAIVDVNPGSPAAAAGLAPGDVIVAINGESVDGMSRLASLVQLNLGEEVVIQYQRGGELLTTRAVPRIKPPPNEGSLGIMMTNPIRQVNWLQALPFAGYYCYEQARQLFLLPGRLLRGQIDPAHARVVGPVGMYGIYQQVRQQDEEVESQPGEHAPAVSTLSFIALISLALGLTNLLPLPALDGGRILFVLPEIIIRRRVPAQYENFVHMIGFVALITLLVYITAQDIINPVVLP
ncbi:MAG: site-2 protease family protein [Anaerolineae bacterium]|nr:site-2 protease family protein [Anaerolineae bacterium]